jgi:hypothetical protein
VKRRVRAHGAPVTKHHGTTHANNGVGPVVHVPYAHGHANQQSSSTHSNSGTHGGGNSGKSTSGGKESHTSAGAQSHGTTIHAPASGQHSPQSDTSTTSTTSVVPGVHGNSATHAHVPVPPAPTTTTP